MQKPLDVHMRKVHDLCMRLRDWREREGFTQEQLAAKWACDQSQIARWESGTRPSERWMKTIFEKTSGEVRPDSFYSFTVAEEPERAA
jgi:transcriptional regulator with XRE-family HTH domain